MSQREILRVLKKEYQRTNRHIRATERRLELQRDTIGKLNSQLRRASR